MKPFELKIFEQKQDLAENVAVFIVETALDAVFKTGSFIWFLAGGSTPVMAYAHLSRWDLSSQMPWEKTHVFFGDEREVPQNDPNSNFAMAQKALLSKTPLNHKQIHPMPVMDLTLAKAAQAYEKTLKKFQNHKSPPWDLLMLGLGNDGHTASLFAQSPLLEEKTLVGKSSPPKGVNPDLNRLTLTPRAINQAHTVLFTVSGGNKAFPLSKTLNLLKKGIKDPTWPVSFIKPQGRLLWYVDKKASSNLN